MPAAAPPSPSPNASPRPVRGGAGVVWALLSAVALVYVLYVIATVRQGYLWDFAVYYGAARASLTGLDPYQQDNIRAHFLDPKSDLPWLYPPALIKFFRPFGRVPFETARLIWLAIKTVVLFALLSVWHRGFCRLKSDGVTLLFFVLAFNGALVWDLASGNASLLEALGVWGALCCWTRRRYAAFALLLAAAAQVKFLPIVLIGLLLLPLDGGKPRWGAFWGGLAAFAAVPTFYAVRRPAQLQAFWQIASSQEVPAPNNATLLTLARDLLGHLSPAAPPGALKPFALLLYGAVTFALLLIGWRVVRRYRARPNATADAADASDAVLLALFAMAIYAFLAPRLIAYSPVIALPPAYVVVRRALSRSRGGVPLAALLTLCPLAPTLLPPPLHELFWFDYLRLAALGAVWLGMLRLLEEAAPTGPEEKTP